jgi:hypothetical protein
MGKYTGEKSTGKKVQEKNTGKYGEKRTGKSHVTSGDVTSGHVTDVISGHFRSSMRNGPILWILRKCDLNCIIYYL